MVTEVAALLPPLVRLEFEGRYAAMLSHEAKNYALLGYDGRLSLKGVAFRSSRAEPFGEAFLRGVIDDYNGSYFLALAAYNAGGGRVAEFVLARAALPAHAPRVFEHRTPWPERGE
jgi:hypothetical protein